MAAASNTTELEKQSLEAHVDLCALRYQQLDNRMTKLENKVDKVYAEIQNGNKAMTKVIVTTAGTVVAGLLSTIVVILLKFN